MSLAEALASANLAHLGEPLSSETLESLLEFLAEHGRTAFLKHIKGAGVEKLSDRQVKRTPPPAQLTFYPQSHMGWSTCTILHVHVNCHVTFTCALVHAKPHATRATRA